MAHMTVFTQEQILMFQIWTMDISISFEEQNKAECLILKLKMLPAKRRIKNKHLKN